MATAGAARFSIDRFRAGFKNTRDEKQASYRSPGESRFTQNNANSIRFTAPSSGDDRQIVDLDPNLAAEKVKQNCNPRLIGKSFEQAQAIGENAVGDAHTLTRGEARSLIERNHAGNLTVAQTMNDRVRD